MTTTDSIQVLRELIEALDRRFRHVERAGEAAIASDAAALKAKAQERLEQLLRETTLVAPR